MDTQSIKDQVRAFLLEEFLPNENPDELTDDLPLISGRILDSFATIKVVSYLERTFGIEFAAHEVNVQNLDSIDQIARFVQSKK
jgi:acyl carrier protein